MKKVIIVDHQPLTRKGIAHTLNAIPEVVVAGMAGSAAEMLGLLEELEPDLIIFGLPLPDASGPDIIDALHHEHPDIHIIVLSSSEEQQCVQRSLQAGAQGYIKMQEPCKILLEAVAHVLAGGFYLSPSINELFLKRFATGEYDKCHPPDRILSKRELEVFEYMGEGLQAEAIAEKLSVSRKTVESYRLRIKSKLNVHNITELTMEAVKWVHHKVTC